MLRYFRADPRPRSPGACLGSPDFWGKRMIHQWSLSNMRRGSRTKNTALERSEKKSPTMGIWMLNIGFFDKPNHEDLSTPLWGDMVNVQAQGLGMKWGCLHARRDCWWFDDHIPLNCHLVVKGGWLGNARTKWGLNGKIIELNVEFSSLPRFGDRRVGFKASLVCNPRATAFWGPARVGSD